MIIIIIISLSTRKCVSVGQPQYNASIIRMESTAYDYTHIIALQLYYYTTTLQYKTNEYGFRLLYNNNNNNIMISHSHAHTCIKYINALRHRHTVICYYIIIIIIIVCTYIIDVRIFDFNTPCSHNRRILIAHDNLYINTHAHTHTHTYLHTYMSHCTCVGMNIIYVWRNVCVSSVHIVYGFRNFCPRVVVILLYIIVI